MSLTAIEETREKRADLFTRMNAINDKALGEKRDLTSEEQQEYDRVEEEFDTLTRSIERTEKLEGFAPKATREVAREREERELGPGDDDQPSIKSYRDYLAAKRNTDWDNDEYRGEFYGWLQDGGQMAEEIRSRVPQELRVQSKATAGAGANLVPVGFGEKIMAVERDLGVMLELANVIRTDSGEQINYPTVTAHGAAAWIGENGSYTPSDETFGQVSLAAYKDGTIVLVSEELVTDASFDLEEYLTTELGTRIGILANTAFWIGDGSGKPTGLATTVQTGVTAATGNTTTIPADNLFDLFHSVKAAYRRNAHWAMNDATAKALRKVKDTTNQYLWQPGLTAGQPDTLLTKPVAIDPDIPTPAANAKSLYFGDFKRAYTVRVTGNVFLHRMTERYADNGQIGFRGYQRFDGKQINTEAVKAYAHSAT